MTERAFYSDRQGLGAQRDSEVISAQAWGGLVVLIRQRMNDGSLARAFPQYACPDDPGRNTITGTDETAFLSALTAHVPALPTRAAPPPHVRYEFWLAQQATTMAPAQRPLDPEVVPDTATALDVVDFVGRHIDQPTVRESHSSGFPHAHYTFKEPLYDPFYNDDLPPGQAQWQSDIELLFSRCGIAFTVDGNMRVQRLGPPEARPLIAEFRPQTGDATLNALFAEAMERFLSRDPGDRQTAIEKLWDAFERFKTIEDPSNKKKSADQLLDRAVGAGFDGFRSLLDTEFFALKDIGNNFMIRHYEVGKHPIPSTDAAADYLFVRLASLMALVLRETGRMG